MNIASIDIGTNTVLLLIVNFNPNRNDFVTILNEYRMPRIGRDLIAGKPITENSRNNLYNVLREYKHIIEQHNCQIILEILTSM